MNLDAKQIVAKVKALPRALRIVVTVAVADLVLVAAAMFILNSQMEESQSHVDQLHDQLNQLRKQNVDLRKEMGEYPDLLNRYNRAVEQGVMVKTDRLKLVNGAQDRSGHFHIPDLHYKLETEDKGAAPTGKYRIESTLVTFENGGLLDTEVMAFWDELLANLPAHYRMAEAVLERKRDIDSRLLSDIRAGRPAATVAVKLTFHWTSLQPVVKEGQ